MGSEPPRGQHFPQYFQVECSTRWSHRSGVFLSVEKNDVESLCFGASSRLGLYDFCFFSWFFFTGELMWISEKWGEDLFAGSFWKSFYLSGKITGWSWKCSIIVGMYEQKNAPASWSTLSLLQRVGGKWWNSCPLMFATRILPALLKKTSGCHAGFQQCWMHTIGKILKCISISINRNLPLTTIHFSTKTISKNQKCFDLL